MHKHTLTHTHTGATRAGTALQRMVPKTRDLPQYHHVVGAMLRVVLWGLGRHNARVPVIFLFYSIFYLPPVPMLAFWLSPIHEKALILISPITFIYAHTHTYVRTYMCTYIHVSKYMFCIT